MEPKENENPWIQILRAVQTKIDPNSFETWFDPTNFIGQEQDCLYIKVPNAYFRDWLSFHYSNVIAECCRDIFDKTFDIRYIHEDTPAAFMRRSPDDRKTKQGPAVNPNLNPNYTFENFVVGSCNQFAHAAATAVSKNLAKSYNPLYIYGGAGLGKTHLMNAIGHYALQQSARAKILYVTTEKFMNDLVTHLQYGKVLEFREKYRSVDILLMDDIHYLAGRERTKEEFFHTFNHLYDSQKQIVISSDCPPKEIPHLEERFRSRFEWGLIADLKPPDIETRIAILKKKAEAEAVAFPESVALYIADKVQTNIRELEGYMRRVIAFASLKGERIDLDLTKEALKGPPRFLFDDRHCGKDPEAHLPQVQDQAVAAQIEEQLAQDRLPPPDRDVPGQGADQLLPARDRQEIRWKTSHDGHPQHPQDRQDAQRRSRIQQRDQQPHGLHPMRKHSGFGGLCTFPEDFIITLLDFIGFLN